MKMEELEKASLKAENYNAALSLLVPSQENKGAASSGHLGWVSLGLS